MQLHLLQPQPRCFSQSGQQQGGQSQPLPVAPAVLPLLDQTAWCLLSSTPALSLLLSETGAVLLGSAQLMGKAWPHQASKTR